MKIIKNGRSENKSVQIGCYKCKSTLEVVPTDIVSKNYDYRDGNSYLFRCAVCGSSIYVDMSVCKWSEV